MSPRLISGGRKVVTELSSVVGDAMDNGWIPVEIRRLHGQKFLCY